MSTLSRLESGGRKPTLELLLALARAYQVPLDELELHLVPVILGDGMRLLGPGLGLDDMEAIELTPARVIATPSVTHVRYTVHGRRPLLLDGRGRDEQPATA